jgi:hypothetical protein
MGDDFTPEQLARWQAMSDSLTPSQRKQLKQWIAKLGQLISTEDARALIKRLFKTTDGHAQALLTAARKSGEVQFMNDDGIVGDAQYDYAWSKDDLVGWLKRQPVRANTTPAKNRAPRYRYAGDAALIKQGRKLVAEGMSKLAAAKELAPKANGGNLDQRVARLRKLI